MQITIQKTKLQSFKVYLQSNLAKDPYKFKYMPEIIDSYPMDDSVNPGYAMVKIF